MFLIALGLPIAAAQARTLTVLHAFEGGTDGETPTSGVIRDTAGNLYGTTQNGGGSGCSNYGCGVAYKIDSAGVETVLHSFTGGADGGSLWGLIRDGAGNLYGNAQAGGAGFGLVFKLNQANKETVLYDFAGGADGAGPTGNLIRDSAGNLYGTTSGGGNIASCGGCGTVFKVDSTGKHTVLHSFTGGTGGSAPVSGVVMDAAGNLYGTTTQGGDLACGNRFGCGTVFKVDAAGVFTVLYGFAGGAAGNDPFAALTLDAAGNLYGTTVVGGDLSLCSKMGCGTVFKVDSAGNETVLYTFEANGVGRYPYGRLIRDTAGNIWGTANQGGKAVGGTVFKLGPSGNATVLHSFTFGPEGANPEAGLIRDAAGNLYGTAVDYGDPACNNGFGCGTVFKIAAAAP